MEVRTQNGAFHWWRVMSSRRHAAIREGERRQRRGRLGEEKGSDSKRRRREGEVA
jgi:hypothetical protein